MLASLLTETVSVKRFGAVEDTDQLAQATLHASLACHIQPDTEDTTEDLPGSFGRDWLLMCNTVDLKEDDRVTWNSKEYRVIAVSHHDMFGEAHTEARIRANV